MSLARRFVFQGQYASHRRRQHGAPAGDISAEHFVIFIQNHDQVGNRAGGEVAQADVHAGHHAEPRRANRFEKLGQDVLLARRMENAPSVLLGKHCRL